MTHVEDVLLWAIAQRGDRYIFGAEAKASDPDPDAFDCSELVEWSSARAGVTPRVPDGAYYQWVHTKEQGRVLSVAEALRTRGALLFVGDGTGVGRNAITHVAWSLGDGTTIEARGSKWGVGTWPAASRFDFAGTIPGVDYTPGHGRLPARPLPQEDGMTFIITPDQPTRVIVAVDGKLIHVDKGEGIDADSNTWDLRKDPVTWARVLKAYGNTVVV